MFTHQASSEKLLESLVVDTGEGCPKTQVSRAYQTPLLYEVGTLESLQGGHGRQRDKGYGWCYIA